MNEETKPSILLSLPPELWHQIMEANEDDEDSYYTLRHAALAHRTLQPYAQEELLRILIVRSEKQLIALVESLQGSSRLAEYAKRTESIELELMRFDEGESQNELITTLFRMCCNTKKLYFEAVPMRLSNIARLTNLRDLFTVGSIIYIDIPMFTFARMDSLVLIRTDLLDEHGNDDDLDLARSLFSPAQFPALRRISIDDIAIQEDVSRFNLILPQLVDIQFYDIRLSVVATQLPHCTSLKILTLQVNSTEEPTELVTFFNSLRGLNLEDFRYWDGRKDWESSLRDVRSVMAIVGEMKTLKKLSLAVLGINDQSEVAKKWRGFKEEVRKTCQKNKVQMVDFDSLEEFEERHDLTWVD